MMPRKLRLVLLLAVAFPVGLQLMQHMGRTSDEHDHSRRVSCFLPILWSGLWAGRLCASTLR